MAGRRLSMRKIKEVLRLKHEHSLSKSQIAKSCKISRSTVKEYLQRAKKAGLGWPLDSSLDDVALEARLFPVQPPVPVSTERSMPPMDYLYRELKRKSVTLQLLWFEYKESNPDGYQYSQFCNLYRQWRQRLDVTLRQEHRAGEKLFVDYAGQTVPVIDPATGEVTEAAVFIAALGASSYTFAEASPSQELPFWILSHVRAFEFLGGVPEILVPDNLKSGVTKPCRYEPDINPTYHELAEHYGTAVIPARVRRPKDKAKVESAVFLAERWILAALRNHTFFSLDELNRAIAAQLEQLNNRPFQKLDTTRRELFETIDKPALKPLPPTCYELAQWKKARVNIDYHIELDRHYYSVPYQLAKQQVDVRFTATTVEVLFKNKRVASHQRNYRKGSFTSLTEHMPKAHQKHLEWTPSRVARWAEKTGPCTQEIVNRIMESRPHPEQGFRSCLGIIRLATHYSTERLERACARALSIKAFSFKSVQSILKKGLDQQDLLLEPPEDQPTLNHTNLRGQKYYH